MLRHAWIEEPA
jgi:hypothetical protein